MISLQNYLKKLPF